MLDKYIYGSNVRISCDNWVHLVSWLINSCVSFWWHIFKGPFTHTSPSPCLLKGLTVPTVICTLTGRICLKPSFTIKVTVTIDTVINLTVHLFGDGHVGVNRPFNVWLIITTLQRSCRKVMFSVMSVCHSVNTSPCDHYHDPFDLTVQGLPPSWTSDMGHPHPQICHGTPPAPAPLPASDIWWPSPVQTCSLEDLHPTVIKSAGHHWSTYGWQAGGAHPTEMLSCFHNFWFSRVSCWYTTLPILLVLRT